MGRFREKMDRDMQIRGYSTSTRDIYLRCVRDFVKYFMVRPDRLNQEDINRYQQYLIEEKKVSVPYFNQAVSAIRFFMIMKPCSRCLCALLEQTLHSALSVEQVIL